MATMNLSETLLWDLKKQLMLIGEDGVEKAWIITLSNTIDQFLRDNNPNHPELIKNLRDFIDKFSTVSPEIAANISNIAKGCCRECMFHMDDCFINVIFLIFKSVELKTYLEPNTIRPTLRTRLK